MLQSALEDMESDANAGLTIFLNHSYNVPEDVGGMVTRAQMIPRGVDGSGAPNYDLDFDIDINQKNKRAVDCWEAVDSGHKLGLSIGAMIPDGGAMRDKKSGALQIGHVKLLETSIVGIPANPRSWIQNAVRALTDLEVKRSTTHQLGAPTLTLEAGRYHIEGSVGDLQLAGVTPEELEAAPPAGPKILEIDPDVLASMCGEEVEDLPGLICNYEKDHAEGDGHSWEGLLKAACPDCGGSKGSPKGSCGNAMHKDVEPDAEKARVQVITIDTDDPAEPASSGGDSSSSQGAGDSDPDTGEEFSAPAPDVVADATAHIEGLGEVEVTQLTSTVELLKSVTTELVETRRQLGEAVVAKAAAEQERDSAIEQAGAIVLRTGEIIEQLGNTPLGRKTSVKTAQTAAEEGLGELAERLSAFGYSPGFQKMLTSTTGDKA